MGSKNVWVIETKDIIRNTNFEKVLRCYDFQNWEKEELRNLENVSDITDNEFKWEYVRGTLELTDERFFDIGEMVKDLIEDIKMGYHRLSEEAILYDIKNSEVLTDIYDKTEIMNFDFKVYRDYVDNKVCAIAIYFNDDSLSYDEKEREINELFSYLELERNNEIVRI